MKNNKYLERIRKIKVVLTDVDGVLTDGGMYYSENGEMLKKFNTRDGMGVELLLQNKIKTIFITTENSKITKSRGKKVKAAQVLSGIKNKENELIKICKKYSIKPENIAYIGDDINDISLMKKIGFSCAPLDCNNKVKKIANFVCSTTGGNGAFRELADLILSIQVLR